MARYFQIIILVLLTTVFLAPDLTARTSNESLNSRNKWRKWMMYERHYKADLTKSKVIHLDRTSIRQPFEFGGPVLDSKNIYIGVHDKEFYAVSIKPRKKIWTNKISGEIETKAALNDSNVFVGDSDGFVYCWDKNTGKEIWKSSILEPIASSPTINNGTVYILTISGRLFALDESNGKEIWHTQPRERVIGFSFQTSPAPIVINDTIYIGTPVGSVVAFNKTGQKLWELPFGDESAQVSDIGDIITDGKKIFIAVPDGSVFAVDPKSGETVWDFPLEGAYAMTLDEDKLYVSGSKAVYLLDSNSGTPIWEHEFEHIFGLSPVASGKDFIAVSSTNKQLYILSKNDGEIVLNRYLRGGSYSQPFTDNDKVYVLSNAARLYSFKIDIKPRKEKKK